MIDFPASPTPGQQFTAAGVTWIWDGAKWLPEGLSPTVAPGINDNRVINGDMRIDQRNNGASGTAYGYTIDRWQFSVGVAARGTWGQSLNAVAGPVGFPYYLGFQNAAAYTVPAGDFYMFQQVIEADFISDLAWGTASAQSVTLSFWTRSSLTGTFGGTLKNSGTRSYPFSYAIPTANTWTKIVLTIPGDTTGAWVMSGNGAALQVNFSFGVGSTFSAPANAWANGNLIGPNGSVSVVGTTNATFYLTGVKLEIGSVATPFNRQSLAKSMADCQRYYQTGLFGEGGGSPQGGVGAYYEQSFAVQMRSQPTLIANFMQQTNCASSALNASGASQFQPYTVVAAAGGWALNGSFTASAEL